jgi:uncharacterized protein YlaN (UPF0358 family)
VLISVKELEQSKRIGVIPRKHGNQVLTKFENDLGTAKKSPQM